MTAATGRKPRARMTDQIVDGAERAFLESGYDLTTMDTVARHAGVARASVYNNFASKELLFLAVMQRGIAAFVARAVGQNDPQQTPLARIRTVAINFMRAAGDTDSVEMYRTVVAQGARFPELSETLHSQGLFQIERKFCELAHLAGRDSIAEPARFAEHLVAMLMGGFFGRRLLKIGGHPADGDGLEAYVDRAIGALLPMQSAD